MGTAEEEGAAAGLGDFGGTLLLTSSLCCCRPSSDSEKKQQGASVEEGIFFEFFIPPLRTEEGLVVQVEKEALSEVEVEF